MNAQCKSLRQASLKSNRCTIESLEDRRLLSGWTTSDDFVQPPAGIGNYAIPAAMTADSAGNVFAVGESVDYSNNHSYAIARRKSSASSQWQTVAMVQSTGSFAAKFTGVAVAPSGDVYLCGIIGGSITSGAASRVWKGTWDATGTSLSLSVVDTQSTGQYEGIAVDAAGNVFVVGHFAVYKGSKASNHWFVRKQDGGQGAFAAVDDYIFNSSYTVANAVSVIPSGPNAGVYVVGRGGGGDSPYAISAGANWIVRKSSNAGSSWSNVDTFQLDPSTNAPAVAKAIAVNENGTLSVMGSASNRVRTGGTPNKPVYTTTHRWYMRSSSDGGASWSNHDVYPESASTTFNGAMAVTTDRAGNTYVAGTLNSRSIVRSNAGGSWSTSDDAQLYADGQGATAMTRDASGTVYVGGSAMEPAPIYDEHWIVRAMNPVTTVQSGGGTDASIFANSRIADPNEDKLEELL